MYRQLESNLIHRSWTHLRVLSIGNPSKEGAIQKTSLQRPRSSYTKTVFNSTVKTLRSFQLVRKTVAQKTLFHRKCSHFCWYQETRGVQLYHPPSSQG